PWPPAGHVVLRLDVTSANATLGESWAQWFITASGTRANSALDAVRAVVTRTPSPPSLQVVSRAADGRPGNDTSGPANVSGDARFVTFTSTASDLATHDYNLQEDVFVFDRETLALECLSTEAGGATGNGRSYNPRISRDGRYVVFQSGATNLIAGDTNDREDVFLFDRQTRTTTRVSVGPGGVQSSRDSGLSRISGDGRYVAFESLAENFVPGDTPTIPDDNRYLLFSSSATDLAVPNFDSNSVTFLYDRETAQLSQINPPRVAGRQRGGFFGARLAPDGRFITMLADVAASAGGSNYVTGVFLYDRLSGTLAELR